jgi:transposase
MKRYVVGQDRSQSTLFPEVLDDYIAEDNPVRVVDVFVDELDLKDLGFEGAELSLWSDSRTESLSQRTLQTCLAIYHPAGDAACVAP